MGIAYPCGDGILNKKKPGLGKKLFSRSCIHRVYFVNWMGMVATTIGQCIRSFADHHHHKKRLHQQKKMIYA